MVLITGPRQVGKTYLAKEIMGEFIHPQYLNWDDIEGRQIIRKQQWRVNADLLIFDEIHQMRDWKRFLKGVYDSKPREQSILVTGSARLRTFSRGGESLAGRFLHLRLNPLSLAEIKHRVDPVQSLELFGQLGTFPEPFLSQSPQEAARWRNQYFTQIIREDILDFTRIQEIHAMKLLLEMLRTRVGSPLSFKAIAEDLSVSPNTVKKYIQILEDLYIVFLIRPWHHLIYRSIKQAPKLYFYDPAYLKADDGIILENICALHLLKYSQYLYDVKGEELGLYYLRNKEKKEVDFALVQNNQIQQMIEIKRSGSQSGKGLAYFKKKHSSVAALQLVQHLRNESDRSGIRFRKAADWLARLPV